MLLASVLLHTFLINATVSNIVERTSLEKNITETSVHIGELESVYMGLRAGITPELAASLGFNETENVVFAVRGLSTGLAKLDK